VAGEELEIKVPVSRFETHLEDWLIREGKRSRGNLNSSPTVGKGAGKWEKLEQWRRKRRGSICLGNAILRRWVGWQWWSGSVQVRVTLHEIMGGVLK